MKQLFTRLFLVLQIRRKRLARLEVQNTNPGPSTSQPVSPSTSQNAVPFTPPPAPVDRGIV